MSQRPIVMLAGPDESTNFVYHALRQEFDVARVIVEQPVSRLTFLKKRIKRLGLLPALGQVLFRLLAAPVLRRSARRRVAEIMAEFALDAAPLDEAKVVQVNSANDQEVARLLRELQPVAVVLNGTRIISKEILNSVEAPFINMHAGITPRYRGVHGGYWALVEDNRPACGVTVHFVDAGIDTGEIISQAKIAPTAADNFATYPLLQVGAGLRLLIEALRELAQDRLQTAQPPVAESKLWSHPTLWGYLLCRFRNGVK